MIASANETMHRGRSGATFTIRPCASLEELDQCIALQQQTWGSPEIEVVPRNMFVLAQALGGHVLGAWDAHGAMAGYAMAIAALEPADGAPRGTWMRPLARTSVTEGWAGAPVEQGSADSSLRPQPYLHSHQVAVAARYQNEGLGFALKLAQRTEALRRGIRRMRWTFDPTMARNAYFNLSRLGATVRLYVPDFYGPIGSRLQAGLPTDRLLAEWELESPRVWQAIERRPLTGTSVRARVTLPAALSLCREAGDVAEARRLQRTLGEAIVEALQRGLEVCGFVPDAEGGGEYLFCACARPLPQVAASIPDPAENATVVRAENQDGWQGRETL